MHYLAIIKLQYVIKKLINERELSSTLHQQPTRSLTEVCKWDISSTKSCWKWEIHNSKLQNSRARICSHTKYNGFDKKNKKKIVLWFCQLAEKERKFTWEVKQSEIFFLLRHENVDKVIETKVFFVVLFYVFCSSCTSYPFSFRLV